MKQLCDLVICSLFLGLLTFGSFSSAQQDCQYSRGITGVCRDIRECPSVIRDLRNRVRHPVSCGTFNGRYPVVCCPTDDGSPNPISQIDISDPQPLLDCGRPTNLGGSGGNLRFERSLEGPIRGPPTDRFHLVGAIPAFRYAWPWMALLGFRESPDNINWFCAGSLINNRWILTAAHCFDKTTVDVVRLGEHDYADPRDGARHKDVGVSAPVIFPNYTFPQAYHDLALLKLEHIVTFQTGIQPLCLPWGNEISRNLEGKRVTVTGWGDTLFGGTSSSILQEVEVTVFPSSDCDRSYQTLRDYGSTWPQGIGSETICSGDRDGGKDACQGDSGGPMVSKDSRNRYTLAGVVSLGYGCGAREYPGLYVNIRRPEYLAWIKKIAF